MSDPGAGNEAGTSEIQRLDDRTVSHIAAGEVVERPASVVKELVENAIDADASRISVAVEDGGRDAIRVRDDGTGIAPSQLPRAVAEHTTSKLENIADLDSGMTTLGFRGEALHAIGAVSRLTLRSRPPDSDVGGELVVSHGTVGTVERAGCPVGTTVVVEDLFGETPARRKFLKTASTEFDRITRRVAAYALANPGIAVSLEHDDREVFATPGDGSLQNAVLSVYGREVAEAMITVGEGDPSQSPAWDTRVGHGPGTQASDVTVSGLVSHPEITRASREYITTFVNGRAVRSAAIRSGILDAYGGQLAADRFPFAVLSVALPPDTVDVNVHPRKTEVRFDDAERVSSKVRETVRAALLDHGVIRSTAPRGQSAPDEASVDPEIVGGAGTQHESAADSQPAGAGSDRSEEDSDSTDTTTAVLDAWSETNPSSSSGSDSQTDSHSHPDPPDTESSARSDPTSKQPAAPSGRHSETAADQNPSDRPTPRDWQTADDTATHSLTVPAQATLDGETTAGRTDHARLPSMRLLGQYADTYLVAESEAGLLLIDQHAADERINYERLRAETGPDSPVQSLATPVELELTSREAELFAGFADALTDIGFHAERVGDQSIRVTAVPTVFDATVDPAVLRDTLDAFASDFETGEAAVESIRNSLLADLACHPSITGNTPLTEGSAVDLLDALDGCQNPYACPHGRPVIVEFGNDEIERRFERDYPGHQARRPEDE